MTTTKTPAEIARDILSPTIADDGIAAPVNHSLIYRWAERAIEADRAQRPTASHAEAQELHMIVSGLVRGLRNGREYVTEREAERALEIAALIVSDTEA